MHSGTAHRTALDILMCILVLPMKQHYIFVLMCILILPMKQHCIYVLMCILVPPGEQRYGVHSGTGRGGRSLCLRQDVCVWRWNRLIIVNKDDCQSDGILPEGARSVLMSTASLVARQRTLIAWARFACCLGIVRGFKLSFSTEEKRSPLGPMLFRQYGIMSFQWTGSSLKSPSLNRVEVFWFFCFFFVFFFFFPFLFFFCNRKGSWLYRHIMWEGRVVAVAFTAL